MAHLFGVASAIHGRTFDRMTASVVEGTTKDDFRLWNKWTEPVEIANPDSIRQTMRRLLSTVTETVGLQRAAEPKKVGVPVVFGWPVEFPGPEFYDRIRSVFRHLESGKHAKPFPIISQSERRGPFASVSKTAMDHIRAVMSRHVRTQGLLEQDVTIQGRVFAEEDYRIGATTLERHVQSLARVNHERDALLLSLRDRAERGDEESKIHLRAVATEFGRVNGATYRETGHDGSARFYMTGPRKPPFTTSPFYNMIQWLDLRQRFGQGFMAASGIRHHMSIKAPTDPPSPPFADVTATYLADKMDKLSGVQEPRVVMVNHDPQ